MDYQALIDETKKKIEDFSFDDSAYQAIYDKARSHLEKAYGARNSELNAALKKAQQSAVGANALDTRSLQEKLAIRGLARSGESALLRLNQRLSLNNALSKLSNEAMRSKTQLYSQHEDELAKLAATLGEQKNAAAEAEKRSLYERLGELERRKADEDFRRDELSAKTETERQKIAAAAAKYSASESGGKTDKSDSGKSKKSAELELDTDAPKSGFIKGLVDPKGNTPDYNPSKAADSIMKTCGAKDRVIRSANMKNKIRRELARLISTSDLSAEYAFEVLQVLKSHGFDTGFDVSMARSRELKDANYVYQSSYDKYYYDGTASGMSAAAASERARKMAADKVMERINESELTPQRRIALIRMLWMI